MNDENETNKKPLDTGGEAEVQNTPADKNTSGIDDSLYNPYEELSDSFDEMKEEAGVEEFSPDASIVPPPDEDEPNTAMEADEPNTDNSNADKTVDVENSLDDDRVVEAPDYLSALTDEEASEIEEEEKSKSGEDAIQSDDTGGGFGTTKEAAKDMSFDSQKVSVLEASRKPTNKSGPKTLNKKFLLSAVTITLGGIFLAAILLPSGRHKKKDEEEKPVGGISLGNIEAYAKRSERPKTPVYYKEQEGDRNMKDVKSSADEKPQRETKYDENGEVILPPVEIIDTNPKPYYAATPASTTGTGGSGGGSSPKGSNFV